MSLSEEVQALAQEVGADIKELRAEKVSFVSISQAAYDALPVKDPNVLYGTPVVT